MSRKTVRVIKVNGVPVHFVTLKELSEMVGYKPQVFRKWESKQLFPKCNFRTKATGNGKQAGDRLYSLELAEKIAAVIKTAIQRKECGNGIKMAESVTAKLFVLMKEEKTKLTANAISKI